MLFRSYTFECSSADRWLFDSVALYKENGRKPGLQRLGGSIVDAWAIDTALGKCSYEEAHTLTLTQKQYDSIADGYLYDSDSKTTTNVYIYTEGSGLLARNHFATNITKAHS